jgi:hypothetical protein
MMSAPCPSRPAADWDAEAVWRLGQVGDLERTQLRAPEPAKPRASSGAVWMSVRSRQAISSRCGAVERCQWRREADAIQRHGLAWEQGQARPRAVGRAAEEFGFDFGGVEDEDFLDSWDGHVADDGCPGAEGIGWGEDFDDQQGLSEEEIVWSGGLAGDTENRDPEIVGIGFYPGLCDDTASRMIGEMIAEKACGFGGDSAASWSGGSHGLWRAVDEFPGVGIVGWFPGEELVGGHEVWQLCGCAHRAGAGCRSGCWSTFHMSSGFQRGGHCQGHYTLTGSHYRHVL